MKSLLNFAILAVALILINGCVEESSGIDSGYVHKVRPMQPQITTPAKSSKMDLAKGIENDLKYPKY